MRLLISLCYLALSYGQGTENVDAQSFFPWSFFSRMIDLVRQVPRIEPALSYQPSMRLLNITYRSDDGVNLIGYMAYKSSESVPHPAVLIVPDWDGRDEYENRRAREIADLGYVGFAIDVFGNGKRGQSPEENRQLITPFRDNRTKLLERLQAALTEIRKYPFVDSNKVAAMGYCFGGTAVLDTARAGLDLKGVVSFHGGLTTPQSSFPRGRVVSKVLVLTGYDDPGIPPDQVTKFQQEMKDRGVNWELDSYSNTVHAFTVPTANTPGQNMYNEQSDKRSWERMKQFYREIFEEDRPNEL